VRRVGAGGSLRRALAAPQGEAAHGLQGLRGGARAISTPCFEIPAELACAETYGGQKNSSDDPQAQTIREGDENAEILSVIELVGFS